MEIKIQCDCGQKFKFDVEPVNGRMPWEVNCPVCGLPGTDKANWIIAQTAPAGISAPLAPIGSVGSVPPTGVPIPPPPIAVRVTAPAPATEPPKPRLVIHRPPAAAAESAPPVAAPTAVPRPAPRAVAVAVEPEASDNKLFFRGSVGAVIGGLLGMAIWYGLIKATGKEFGLVAWGVGGLVGLGARWMGKQGCTALGVVAGLCAMLSIVGGEFIYGWSVWSEAKQEFVEAAHKAYDESLVMAKEAVALENDQQIKAFIAKHDYNGNAAEVTGEDIRDFKETELPELRDLAGGKMTREQYEGQMLAVTKSLGLVFVLFNSLSFWTLLWLFLGVGTAYKLGADAD